MNKTLAVGLALLCLGLAACAQPAAPAATATALPSTTPTSTFTPTTTATPAATQTSTTAPTRTPRPTQTPQPTRTPAPTATLGFGPAMPMSAGGFSFRPPLGYDVDVQGAQVGVFDQAGTIIISISGGFFGEGQDGLAPEAIIDEFLDSVAERGGGNFVKKGTRTITVNGVEGLAIDLGGTYAGAPIEGQAILAQPSATQYLFGLGIANLSHDLQRWRTEGARVFAGLLETVVFGETAGTGAGPCPVAQDAAYGYSPESAIRVGGGAFEGPPRAQAYLGNLRGPNGETLSWQRRGSLPTADTILDIYDLKGLSQPITLYIDQYSFTPPMAPVGLTCAAAFTLTPP